MKYINQLEKYGNPGFPAFGYLRVRQIIGDSKSDPPIPAILPVCPSTFWAKIKNGDWDLTPVKLSANVTGFRVEQVRELIESLSNQEAA